MCSLCLGLDDEPEDGPQHYILVMGFYQPHLIGALDAIGVHVANVIKLSAEYKQSDLPQEEEGPASDTGNRTLVEILNDL